jgi:hypothetical protein
MEGGEGTTGCDVSANYKIIYKNQMQELPVEEPDLVVDEEQQCDTTLQ